MDVRALVKACPGITYLDLSNVSTIDNYLISLLLPHLPLLEIFILKRNIKVNNEIFIYLAKHSTNLKHLEIGGLPTEFNNNITYEGIETLTMLKSKLRKIRFEYCAKIGDMSL